MKGFGWGVRGSTFIFQEFVDNCSAGLRRLHIQTSMTLTNFHVVSLINQSKLVNQELNRDPKRLVKVATNLEHLTLMSMADQKSKDVRDKGVEVSAFSWNLKARDRWFEHQMYFSDSQRTPTSAHFTGVAAVYLDYVGFIIQFLVLLIILKLWHART